MREKLNDNPLAQVAILGVLALVVGFLLISRMGGSSTETAAPAPTTDATATAPVTDATGAVTPAVPVTPDSSLAPAPGAAPAPAGESDFKAGPGLPKDVVDAYNANKVVALLIVNKGSVDDDALKSIVDSLKGKSSDTTLFLVESQNVADYSRIAQGVDLQQTPALVVLRPKNLSPKGSEPTATIEYGYRGPDSVAQMVEDALYKGPTDLPYYPQ
jgi:hypothetical protein